MRRTYDTPFGQFYASLPYGKAAELARKANTSSLYLYMLASGRRRAGMDIASRLMAADERITMGMLRPDHFID